MSSLTEVPQQWFILRGEQKEGPHEYHAMVSMMQQNWLQDTDYVWNPSMLGWAQLGDLPDFSKDRLIRILETQQNLKSAFNRRSSPRIEFHMPLFGHDNHQFFQGRTLDIGEHGGLLLLNTPLLEAKQEIFLNIREGVNGERSFNARAEVIRKNFTRTKIHEKVGLRYAVKYLEVAPNGIEILKKIINDKLKEIA